MEVLSLYFTCLFNILKNNINYECTPRTVHQDVQNIILNPLTLLEVGCGKHKALYQKIIEYICEEPIPKTYLNFILRGIERIFDHFGKQVAQSDMTEEDVFFYYFCLDLVAYREWKLWKEFRMNHDMDEAWETTDPTSEPVITEEGIALLYDEYEYLLDPRRWMLPRHGLLAAGEVEASWN